MMEPNIENDNGADEANAVTAASAAALDTAAIEMQERRLHDELEAARREFRIAHEFNTDPHRTPNTLICTLNERMVQLEFDLYCYQLRHHSPNVQKLSLLNPGHVAFAPGHAHNLGLALLNNTQVSAIYLNLSTLLPLRPNTIQPLHESVEAFMNYIEPLVQYVSTNAYLLDVRISGGLLGSQQQAYHEAMATAFLTAIATNPYIQHVHYSSPRGISIALFIQFLTRAVESRTNSGSGSMGWTSLRLEFAPQHNDPTVHDVTTASALLARLVYHHELETLHVSQGSSDFMAATFNALVDLATGNVLDHDGDTSGTSTKMTSRFIALKELKLTGGVMPPQYFEALARLLQTMATSTGSLEQDSHNDTTTTSLWPLQQEQRLRQQRHRLQHLELRNFTFGQRNAGANDTILSPLLRGLLVPNHAAAAASTHTTTAVVGTTVAKLTLQRCLFYNAAADALIAFMQTPIAAPTVAAETPAAAARAATGTVGSETLLSLSPPTSSSSWSSMLLEELCVDGTGLRHGMFCDRLTEAAAANANGSELNRPVVARRQRLNVPHQPVIVTVERSTGAVLAEMLLLRRPPETDDDDTWNQQRGVLLDVSATEGGDAPVQYGPGQRGRATVAAMRPPIMRPANMTIGSQLHALSMTNFPSQCGIFFATLLQAEPERLPQRLHTLRLTHIESGDCDGLFQCLATIPSLQEVHLGNIVRPDDFMPIFMNGLRANGKVCSIVFADGGPNLTTGQQRRADAYQERNRLLIPQLNHSMDTTDTSGSPWSDADCSHDDVQGRSGTPAKQLLYPELFQTTMPVPRNTSQVVLRGLLKLPV